MIVVVTGSRSLATCEDRLEIKAFFLETVRLLRPVVLHHGGAIGPDSWAAGEFQDIQICHRPVKSLFRTPAQALFDRNKTMIVAAIQQSRERHQEAILVACWDGQSRGTYDAMDFAETMHMPLVSIPVDSIRKARG